MKKKRKSQLMIVPSVKLWLEDVESVMMILQEHSNEVEVSDRDNNYDSLQDLIEKKGTRPRSLEITSHTPDILLRFDRREMIPLATSLYASAGSSEGEGSYLKIRALLLDRKRWLAPLFPFWLGVILGVIVPIATFAIPIETFRSWVPDRSIGLLVRILPILYGAIAILLRMGFLYSITLTESHMHESFLARHTRTVVALVIGAVIVIIIERLAELFLP